MTQRYWFGREGESREEQARWFSSLPLKQRMDIFCEITEQILADDPGLPDRLLPEPIPGRIQILSLSDPPSRMD